MSTNKPFYISFNSAEIALMNELCTHEELALYFVLKKMSNFKNASVGHFGTGMTYESLAKAIGRPASQGRAAVIYDRKQAHRLLHSLESKKLVANISTKDKLTCKLPLSLLHFKSEQQATDAATTLLALAGRLPQNLDAESSESEAVPDFPGDSTNAVSTDSTDTTDQSVSVPQYHHPKDEKPNSQVVQGVRTPSGTRAIHPAPMQLEVEATKQPQSSMARAIEKRLAQDVRFDWPQGPKSRENYERWANIQGFTLQKLDDAIARYTQGDHPMGLCPIGLSEFVVEVCAPTRRGRPPKFQHPNAPNGRLIL